MSNTNQLSRHGLHLVKQPIVTLPDGCRILAFWIVNWAGNRIGKISGDMNVETEDEIRAKYVG